MTEATPSHTTYSRVMLKISGEALMGETGFGLHPPTVERIAQEVKSVHDMERLLGRISLSFCNARDIIALKISVSVLPNLLKLLNQSNNFSLNIFKLE